MLFGKNLVFLIIFTIFSTNNMFSAEVKIATAEEISQRAEAAGATVTPLMEAVER